MPCMTKSVVGTRTPQRTPQRQYCEKFWRNLLRLVRYNMEVHISMYRRYTYNTITEINIKFHFSKVKNS